MATYLLTWNPKRWDWHNIQDGIKKIDQQGFLEGRWSCGVTKGIDPEDRIFLMRLGEEPRGIMASGWVASHVFKDNHWGDESKTALYITVHFDTLLNPKHETILSLEVLQTKYESVYWTPQASGMGLPDDVAEQLEKDWAKFLNLDIPIRPIIYADEVDEGEAFQEGAVKQVTVNVYERSPKARTICIKKYGANCFICGFNFGEKFGEIGEGFIHVHHLKPLSEINGEYDLDPIRDLRPVCPNCHAMLHQRKPPYAIEELKEIVEQVAQEKLSTNGE